MVLMLALDVLEGGKNRLCLCRGQAPISEPSYERVLTGDVRGPFPHMAPGHFEFGFLGAHAGLMADGASGR